MYQVVSTLTFICLKSTEMKGANNSIKIFQKDVMNVSLLFALHHTVMFLNTICELFDDAWR